MTRFPRRALAGLIAATALTGSLTACSTGATGTDAADAQTGTGAAEADAFPVTIEHAFGETTVEAEPTRVVTVGWSDADFALDLGVVPVGIPAITWGGNENRSTDWFDAALEEQGAEMPVQYDDTDGVPFDELAQLDPDLILATNSGLTQAEYTKLSKLAPVVAYPDQAWGTPWQDSLEMIGDALGRSEAADALEDETKQAIADAQEQHPALQGTTAAWGWLTEGDTSTVGLYSSLDNRPRMLEELGMTEAGIVEEISDDEAFSGNVSAEKADTIDADVFVYYAEGAPKDPAADPLLGRMPALRNGSAVAVEDNAASLPMSSPTTLSIPVALSDFLPLLDAAAQKARDAKAQQG